MQTIVGLNGHRFQVHGSTGSIYNIISTPRLQINARFDFLHHGRCNRHIRLCFSHPGNYLGAVSVMMYDDVLMKTREYVIESGSIDNGFANRAAIMRNMNCSELWMNVADEHHHHHAKRFKVLHFDGDRVVHIRYDDFNIVIENSDYFVNLVHVSLSKSISWMMTNPNTSPHGLLGSVCFHLCVTSDSIHPFIHPSIHPSIDFMHCCDALLRCLHVCLCLFCCACGVF
jgi:hypothetical protein